MLRVGLETGKRGARLVRQTTRVKPGVPGVKLTCQLAGIVIWNNVRAVGRYRWRKFIVNSERKQDDEPRRVSQAGETVSGRRA